MKNENPHKGHRERMRRKFLEHGIDSFEQHEILELLLFYSYPQRNTNIIAHNLLKKFGSLSGVFDADYKSLTEVEDVGENTATLLKLQSAMCRIYMEDKFKEVKNEQLTPANAGDYVKTLFYGYTTEVFYLLSLDVECRLISADIISKGTVNSAPVYSREVVKKALDTGAAFAILAHNYPNGALFPSDSDIKITKMIEDALSYIKVRLIDHLIVADNRYISLAKEYHVFDKQ